MQAKPRINIPLTPAGKWMERIGILMVLLMWGIAVFSYVNLGERIPTHFNASGEPDSYGNKISLFILAAIGTVLYIGLSALNKYPHVFNYPVQITESNALQQYSNATGFLRYLKTIIPFIFSAIILLTYLTATGRASGLSGWFMPCLIAVIGIPTIFFIVKVFKTK